MTYPYILPPLPYAPAALEPNLGRSSVRLHHDAFFAAYVDRLNGALVPWTQYQDWPLERLLLHWCQLPRTLGQAVRRYGGGVYNHGLYFSSLAPARTTKPSGELLAEVEHSFGSVEGLHRSLKNAAMSVFGSGWVWLVCCSGGLQVTCTANALNDKPLPVYGEGLNVRDWLYVEDHCRAIDLIIHKGRVGEVYNVGGHNEMRNIDIVKLICKELGKPESLIVHVADRKGHDMRYAIDPTKIHNELGWLPETKFADGIKKTIDWYLNHREWWETIISGEYQDYYEKMYGNR